MTSQEDLIDKYLDRVGKPQPTFKNKKDDYTKDMLDHSHHQPFASYSRLQNVLFSQ